MMIAMISPTQNKQTNNSMSMQKNYFSKSTSATMIARIQQKHHNFDINQIADFVLFLLALSLSKSKNEETENYIKRNWQQRNCWTSVLNVSIFFVARFYLIVFTRINWYIRLNRPLSMTVCFGLNGDLKRREKNAHKIHARCGIQISYQCGDINVLLIYTNTHDQKQSDQCELPISV